MLERIRAINSAGYPVLVFDDGFFYDNVLAVRNRLSGKVHPIMGADTFNRLMNCYETNDLSVIERGIYDNCSWHPMRERLEMTFDKCFGDTTFLVFGRNVELKTYGFNASYDFVDFDMNISSTNIRENCSRVDSYKNFETFSEDDWESFMENCEKLDDPVNYDLSVFIGHSDYIEFNSGKEFLECCDEQYKVTDSEINILQKLNLNMDCHGFFSHMLDEISEHISDGEEED